MSRPPHVPDASYRKQVEAMAGYGVPEADIARVIDIDPKTLRKYYRDELDCGHIKANAKVAENLFRKATGDGRESVVAAIFWLKTRAHWRETSVHEVTGPRELVVSWAGQQASQHIEALAGEQRANGGRSDARSIEPPSD